MPITPLPKTPNRSTSPETFADDGDNFLGALPTFATEANALAADVNAKQITTSAAASTASTKAGEASASATQASTSAGAASTKAGEASASATSALASSNNANAKYKLFDERYLGSKTADPTTDNNGQPLLVGSEYWNSTAKVRKVWTGTSWQVANLADAPNDGRIYARKSGTWVELSSHGTIGVAGQQGFGVGIYPAALPSGFSALPGTFDVASPNYGNYSYTDGSVMVFVPRFYYRIGHTSSPNYAVYGLNAIDIVGVDTFTTEAEANAAGYAMHRAFIDGGQVKTGFFIDKYICSKSEDGVSHGRSVRYGVPISLTTDAAYTRSADMTGCVGQLHDAVTLSRARGVGVFNCASMFMFDALAKLSLAHGQAATSTTTSAWFDPTRTKNFPKGCNDNNLADVDDPSVTYQSAGDTGSAMKPKTGSASNLAKTAHNGQACGVVDINGCMYQTTLGLTQAGSSATASGQVTSGDAYTLKPSARFAGLTAGWGGATDVWGTGANLASRYDLHSGFLPWGADTGWVRLGSGTAQVFSPALDGTDYLRSCTGVANLAGYSAAGINAFGVDGCYRYTRENMFPLASGAWNVGSLAGTFCRGWDVNRSNGNFFVGFRSGAYGS